MAENPKRSLSKREVAIIIATCLAIALLLWAGIRQQQASSDDAPAPGMVDRSPTR